MPSIKRHQNWRAVRQRTAEGTNIPNTLFTAVENEPITAEYMLCNQPLPPEKDQQSVIELRGYIKSENIDRETVNTNSLAETTLMSLPSGFMPFPFNSEFLAKMSK